MLVILIEKRDRLISGHSLFVQAVAFLMATSNNVARMERVNSIVTATRSSMALSQSFEVTWD